MMSGAAPTELEIELAEQISERLPSVEQIRFANSGTEATMLALADGVRSPAARRSACSVGGTTAPTITPRACFAG